MPNGFKDFIPEGEDNGAITKDGYQDFVPDKKIVTPSTDIKTPVKQNTKKKESK